MTVAVTFALMHAFGLELHQVSLACLIVVLGMVVDDAVVVADNYVELLDNGVDRPTAAWQCATGLVVPILTATLTIIAAFLPMVIITGMVHDFIIALPLTVSIALASSFIVAMLLTPMLCFVFIRKGLHHRSAEATEDKKRTSLLGTMQRAYDQTIAWCMKHPAVTIAGCLSSLLLGAGVILYSPAEVFPGRREKPVFRRSLDADGHKTGKNRRGGFENSEANSEGHTGGFVCYVHRFRLAPLLL